MLASARSNAERPSRASLHSSGKVREIYEFDGDLLMVASDRISAYDVIMPNPIPDKGRVLTQMSLFWFESTGGICPNHLLSEEVPEEVAAERFACGGWTCTRRVRGARVPLRLGVARVPRVGLDLGRVAGRPARVRSAAGADLHPATKAEVGDHDENIDFDRAAEIIGDRPLMEELRRALIELYQHASVHAEARGIILADTKFEFGASPGRRWSWATRSSRPTPPASGRPTSTSPAARSAPSTSSICATGSTRPAGTAARRRRSSRTRWSPTRGREYLEAYERITGRTLD